MPTLYTTLIITDGTITANLTDRLNYQIADGGWAPGVAELRRSTLGGAGPYQDVVEDITVNVYGFSAAMCLQNLQILSILMDQAERWSRGEPVAAVRLQCQPLGSTLANPLECVILGRADDTPISMPKTFVERLDIEIYEIPDVRLVFRRRGLWLGATDTVDYGSNIAFGAPTEATFAATAAVMSPTDVLIKLVGDESGGTTYNKKLLLIAPTSSDIWAIQAEDMAGTAGFTSVADTTHNASGGRVLRYTPGGITEVWSGFARPPAQYDPPRRRYYHVYATVRSNSATVSWTLRAELVDGYGGKYFTPRTQVDTSTTNPRIIYLGFVAGKYNIRDLRLYVTASSTSGTPVLDIDQVFVLAQNDETSRALTFSTDYSVTIGTNIVTIAHNSLSAMTPTIVQANGILNLAPAYLGDPYVVTAGSKVGVLIVGGHEDQWISMANYKLRTVRTNAYLTPQ